LFSIVILFKLFIIFREGWSGFERMLFFFCGVLSSLTFLFISWFLSFLWGPWNQFSHWFNPFKVIDLTSQDWESARITLLTFWSLSMESLKEERPLVIFVKWVIISSMISFSFILKFSYWELNKSILPFFTWEVPQW